MDLNIIKKSMTNIKPNEEQIKRIEELRETYKSLAKQVNDTCKDSRYKSLAITSLEESLMWGVKSIVME
jgi:hypothetical protein